MNRVRELRQAVPGLTQQALAEQVSVTRQTIIALESGSYAPSLALALRLSQVFACPVEKIFWLEESTS
ncbi:helix-turn-helix domain-containing protein [bacterium]|nr:helix-turn-helix domain-containing protein [bacterium]